MISVSSSGHPRVAACMRDTGRRSISVSLLRLGLIGLCLAWPWLSHAMTPQEYVEDARAYYERGEFNAGIIQLKNALLAEPENAHARLLLGRCYLQLKNGLAAEKELGLAKDLGLARELVV